MVGQRTSSWLAGVRSRCIARQSIETLISRMDTDGRGERAPRAGIGYSLGSVYRPEPSPALRTTCTERRPPQTDFFVQTFLDTSPEEKRRAEDGYGHRAHRVDRRRQAETIDAELNGEGEKRLGRAHGGFWTWGTIRLTREATMRARSTVGTSGARGASTARIASRRRRLEETTPVVIHPQRGRSRPSASVRPDIRDPVPNSGHSANRDGQPTRRGPQQPQGSCHVLTHWLGVSGTYGILTYAQCPVLEDELGRVSHSDIGQQVHSPWKKPAK